ncbi:hypothetical protein ABKN59_008857 [Abortiporus biennis]
MPLQCQLVRSVHGPWSLDNRSFLRSNVTNDKPRHTLINLGPQQIVGPRDPPGSISTLNPNSSSRRNLTIPVASNSLTQVTIFGIDECTELRVALQRESCCGFGESAGDNHHSSFEVISFFFLGGAYSDI